MEQFFHEWVMENRAPSRSRRGVHLMNVNDKVSEQQSLTFVGIKRKICVSKIELGGLRCYPIK
jgi:hypothetical protein